MPKKLRQYYRCDVAFRHTLVVERDRRRFRTPRKKPHGVSEMIEVVWSPATICNSKPGRAGATARPANALGVIEWFWRNVSQKNGIKVAKVNSQFESGGATQHMN